MPGKNTSPNNALEQAQITNIERDGFLLLTEDGEFFVPFERYPAFLKARVEQIFDFEQDDDAFCWPGLDIDIELDSIKTPRNLSTYLS